ncbi:hypothetical protein QBZ16_004282 [Prototheca wickerhamii]|uniref:Uncharacterized protein n=1 Tax=Prototheca wickerhamii TaxID=3111 RepID=A0AAD9IJQ8_PROWI|nr:hypothetical protein QBZ16_004282 [Prototheca wickerhamii]
MVDGAEGRASGAARRPPSASGTRSRLSGRSRSRKRGGLSSSSRGSREEPAEDTAASPDVAAKDPRPGGEPDADWAPEGRGAPPPSCAAARALRWTPNPSRTRTPARAPTRRAARARPSGARRAGLRAPGRAAAARAARSGDSSEGRAAPDAAVDGADPLLAWFREHARLLASRGLHALPAALPLLGDRRVEGAGAARATPASTRSPRGKRSRSDGGGEEWERSQSTASSGHARADSSRHSAHSGEDASPARHGARGLRGRAAAPLGRRLAGAAHARRGRRRAGAERRQGKNVAAGALDAEAAARGAGGGGHFLHGHHAPAAARSSLRALTKEVASFIK